MCAHALGANIFGDLQQVLEASLPCSARSASCWYTSVQNESGRGAPTRYESGIPLPADHPHSLACVIAIEMNDAMVLVLVLKPALARAVHGGGYDYGRNALNGRASGTESAIEDQNGIGGAGKDVGHLLRHTLMR